MTLRDIDRPLAEGQRILGDRVRPFGRRPPLLGFVVGDVGSRRIDLGRCGAGGHRHDDVAGTSRGAGGRRLADHTTVTLDDGSVVLEGRQEARLADNGCRLIGRQADQLRDLDDSGIADSQIAARGRQVAPHRDRHGDAANNTMNVVTFMAALRAERILFRPPKAVFSAIVRFHPCDEVATEARP
ncbi:hypothetical protein VSS74_16330 [Conexibacter stalactiti]|uniref:Uncharacterized protein n=1 Tax=Conexibacter stalactiti TaxID=1940611 RepID=A0ABU4HRJ2_9ACTN|nr:hypothetical protein [Conexibacter stalactiti]MDW5595917.1 hypothetical protein [Conexibacter stalactiti]MEC5036559.1 hypothetical protein [Conexibacter stalactiti]